MIDDQAQAVLDVSIGGRVAAPKISPLRSSVRTDTEKKEGLEYQLEALRRRTPALS